MPDSSELWDALHRGNTDDPDHLRKIFATTPENQRYELANSIGPDGSPALYWAMRTNYNRVSKINILLENGADPALTFDYVLWETQKNLNQKRILLFTLLLRMQDCLKTIGFEKAQSLADLYNTHCIPNKPFVFGRPSDIRLRELAQKSRRGPGYEGPR